MERYYIPDSEDIFVGFEGELYNNRTKKWENIKLRHPEETSGFLLVFYNKKVRVPYLTIQQIENEGFISYKGDFLHSFNKGDLYIWYSEESHLMSIEQGKDLRKRKLFLGKVKCINTFRKILKIIGN